MPIETERQAEYPRIVFGDGCFATVYREEYLGHGQVCLILFPEQTAVLRARIADSMEENWEGSIIAAIEGGKSYPLTVPKASIVKLSDDPNMPRWFCTYSITGNREVFNQKELDSFQKLVDINNQLREQLKDTEQFIAKLRDRNKQLVMELSKKVVADNRLFPQSGIMGIEEAMRIVDGRKEKGK